MALPNDMFRSSSYEPLPRGVRYPTNRERQHPQPQPPRVSLLEYIVLLMRHAAVAAAAFASQRITYGPQGFARYKEANQRHRHKVSLPKHQLPLQEARVIPAQ